MNLVEAFRIEPVTEMAFTGAGGKTSAIFAIAHQWQKPIIITTTTHLAAHQAALADQHIVVKGDSLTIHDPLFEKLPAGITLFSGPEGKDGRLLGISNRSLNIIRQLVRTHAVPLLIEADGAKQKLLKAPSEHEPAFPDFASTGVVVANINAIGKPLDDETVHRPALFAKLAEIVIGDEISAEALIRVLLHKQGGLKNINKNIRSVALLNGCDTTEKKALSQSIAKRLLPKYHAVVSANIPHYSARAEATVAAVKEPVATIILAAGKSERMGKPKQLLDWKGKPFIRHIISEALAANPEKVIVVTGAYRKKVEAAINDLPAEIVYNPNWESGQSGSIIKGLAALPNSIGAAIFLLVDQPQVSATLLRKLIETHATSLAAIIGPEIDGKRGNPVLFDRRTFPNFYNLTGDVGGRALFSKFKVKRIPWLDQNMSLDVDTEDDYQKLLDQE